LREWIGDGEVKPVCTLPGYPAVISAPKKENSDLTFVVMLINSWNRINVGFKAAPGSSDAGFGLDKAGLSYQVPS
jgi:hypothetical protein